MNAFRTYFKGCVGIELCHVCNLPASSHVGIDLECPVSYNRTAEAPHRFQPFEGTNFCQHCGGTLDEPCHAIIKTVGRGDVRTFETGATRDTDNGKLDYEGFLSPVVLERYAQYMHKHRKLSDGTLRDSDNWQKGIPKKVYMSSLVRHTMDFWKAWRAGKEDQELACAIMFNIMGWLHETLKQDPEKPAWLRKVMD